MVGVEDLLGVLDILLDPGALLPGNAEHPLEIVSHHRRFRRHRTHRAKLLDLAQGLLAGFLAERGFLDALLQFANLVAAVLGLAELLLNGFQLLVQIVFALRFLYLALYPAANLLLHLKDADLGFHVGVHALEPLRHALDLQQLLLFGDFQRQVRSNGVSQLAGVVDLVDRDQHLRRNFLVQFDVLLELADHRTGQPFDFLVFAAALFDQSSLGFEKLLSIGKAYDAGPLAAFDQHLYGAIRKLQELQDRRHRPDRENIPRRGVVLSGILLSHQEDLSVVFHDVFERAHRPLASHEQRNDHVRKYDDIAQREDGKYVGFAGHSHDAFQLRR